MTLNNLNALPGVQAKGILEPGDKIGSSSLTIVLEASPIVEGAVYTDNYGGKYSGRYRYGMQVIVNEPLRSGGGSVIDGGGLSGCVSIENSENSGDIKGSNSVSPESLQFRWLTKSVD